MHDDDGIDRPITFEELLSRCLGELEFAQTVLANFVSTCEPQLEGLRSDLEKNDWDSLSRKVHRLKGTAATIAARPLRESLEQLEVLIKSDDSTRTDKARQGIDSAARECERINQFVMSGLSGE
jgi:HPt (histidine-containing phosphotransfer) domain-containing protein